MTHSSNALSLRGVVTAVERLGTEYPSMAERFEHLIIGTDRTATITNILEESVDIVNNPVIVPRPYNPTGVERASQCVIQMMIIELSWAVRVYKRVTFMWKHFAPTTASCGTPEWPVRRLTEEAMKSKLTNGVPRRDSFHIDRYGKGGSRFRCTSRLRDADNNLLTCTFALEQ